MNWQDAPLRYGLVSRLLHWGIALLFLLQGLKFLDRVGEGEHAIGHWVGDWHGQIGHGLLVLVGARLLWALWQRRRRPRHPGLAGQLARVGHGLLYLLMLAMPVTGVLFMIGKGRGLNLLGIQWLAPSGEDSAWMLALASWHSPLAWCLALLMAGHVGAALYHQWVLRDGILRRML